ncbi:hypothetical protein GCM10023328_46840 [Modestobacter marinus]|uniref:SAF domain-containing protein n=1 Tax=Modestobacter marinus TaxID=477641 RepID=A0A846LWW9_9ACTN|nr:SAF domain-containing protein [Modestobacter marinus]NIH70245.1 hypothetical protein [Modestobacter marinus]GGL84842.1 hypothetical protein GCM10011589_46610 [Modestobacter marinus]
MPARTEPRTGAAQPTTSGTPADPGTARFGDGSTATAVAAPKLRRRTGLIALGIALVALGSIGAAYLTTVVGNTTAVIAVGQDVERGSVIEAQDLTVAQINSDPALQTVPQSQLDSLIGQRAAVDLAAGSVLTPSSTTTEVIPAQGQSLVGVSLTPAQLPGQPLLTGDEVRVIATPRDQEDVPATAPASYTATVVGVRTLDDLGQVVVDVTVPAATAGPLAAQVATGRIALVLDAGAS